MLNYYEEPLVDDYGLEDKPSDDSKDDSKEDSFLSGAKTTNEGIEAANKGLTLITNEGKADNEKKKKEAVDALVNEVPILEAKIDKQSKVVEELKTQSNELLGALQHNYAVISNIKNMVEEQSNVIENKFFNIETKLNVVLVRIEQAKKAIVQHIDNVEAQIINQHRNRPKQKAINYLAHAFESIIVKAKEFKKFTIDEKVANFDTNEGEPNSLDQWEQTRIPQFENGIYNSLWDIINEDWAIPSHKNDQVSFITLNVLCYGMYFYAYILHYLMEQYTQLLEHYQLNTDIKSYNRCYWKKLNTLNDFASTLIGSNGFFAKVESVLTRVKNIDFIQIYRKDIQLFADANMDNLETYKGLLRRLHSTFMKTAPRMLDPDLDFSTSNTSTVENKNCHATDSWENGLKVSYAIQLLSYNMTTSSLVSKWSPGYTLEDKANPIVKVQPDRLNRTRVVFRRFEGEFKSEPKIVAILKDPNQSEFRDIDRDLFDFASQPNPTISLAMVKFYLAHGANVNAVLERHQVALHGAAQHRGHLDVATELLKNGANIDVQDVEGYTPLSIATERGHHEFVIKLLEHKANVTLTTSEKHHQLTPLHIAVYKGHIKIVQELLKANGIDLNARSIEGFTALHFAAAFDYNDIVSLLLGDSRTEIDPKSYFRVEVPAYLKLIKNVDKIASILATSAKVTPLHLAYGCGNEKVVSQLLAKGANMNARTSDGSTVMHFAAINDNVNLIPDCSNNSIFNSPNVYDITPLYIAYRHNNTAVAKKFLDRCADIDVLLSNQRTMLHVAIQAEDTNVALKLLENGINLAEDSESHSELYYAILLGNLAMVDILLSHDVDPETLDADGDPLIHSIFKTMDKIDASKMLELFIKHNLDVNIQDIDKNTLLHHASAFGYESSVDILLKHPSIDLNAANKKNETPLQLALKVGNVRIANSLFNKGASVTRKGKGEWTAVNYAIAGSITAAQTVSFVEKFLPITKECENTTEAIDVLFDINIPLASEYDKFEVVQFYGENCDWLKHKLESNGTERNFLKIDVDYLSQISGHGNVQVLKYLFPLEKPEAFAHQDSLQLPVFGALKGNTDIKVLQLLQSRRYMILADDFLTQQFPNTTNWNALNYTIMGKGDLQIVQLITGKTVSDIKYPSLHAPYDKKENLMHLAAKANKSDIATFLLEKKVDINALDKDDYLPLHYAARNGDIAMVNYLIQNGAKPKINEKTKAQTTPLIEAVWHDGNLDVVEYLIDNDASIGIKDGMTLMHKAAQLDKTYVAIYLCEKMNSHDCTDKFGETGASVLHYAAANNNINLAVYILSKGIKPNIKDNLNNTPIYYAIRDHGQLQMVKYLHSKKADINSVNVENGENLISLAISEKKYAIAKYLIDAGADMKTAGKSGKTPLHEAVDADQIDLIRMLIQNGADYSCRDGDNLTPIDYIFEYRKDRALQYFMFNYEDKQNGGTLMHERTRENDFGGVQWLIQRGGDVNSPDKLKNTPLHLTAEKGLIDVAKELVQSKCIDISIKNGNGQTALKVAEANNQKEIIDLLKNRKFSRKRRQIAAAKSEKLPSVASSAGRPFGLLNGAVESLLSTLKSLPAQLSGILSFTLDNSNSFAGQSALPSLQSVDLNSTLFLFDVLIRRYSTERYVNTLTHSVTPQEARVYALALVEQLQMAFHRLAQQSGAEQIELDWFDIYRTVERLAINEQYNKIEGLVHTTAREAFALEKFDKNMIAKMVDKLIDSQFEMTVNAQKIKSNLADLHSFSGDNSARTVQKAGAGLVETNKHNLIQF